MRIESKAGFEALRNDVRQRRDGADGEILVCCGTGCLANGSREVAEAFSKELKERNIESKVVKTTGCHGFCERGPLVAFVPAGVLYTKVKAAAVPEVVEKTVENGEIVPRFLYKNPADGQRIEQYSEIPFYKHQKRIAMRNIGLVDPTDILDAVARGAYEGLVHAIFEMSPEAVLEQVEISGLRGRGGAGFNTGRKWRSCRNAAGERRFVICNGDEGDPGAFKDRSIMEGDPHSVLEGMIIAAYAVGAHEGYIYVREEYPLAIENLKLAIHQATENNLKWTRFLRKSIFLGTPHHGAPLERVGNWIDVLLGSTSHTLPFTRIGQVRSAGITDLRYGNLLEDDWLADNRFRPGPDSRRHVPLPDGVDCFAVAGRTTENPSHLADRLIGDGLVPLESALGQHKKTWKSLKFPETSQFIAVGHNHLELLSSRSVAAKILEWIL